MGRIYVLQKDELGGELYRRIYLLVRKNRWTWQSIGATFGLASGLLSILLSLLLWAGARFLAPGSFGSLLNALSTVLMVLSLPLLALGAYCLDLLEKKPPVLPLPIESRSAGPSRWLRLRPRQPDTN